MNNGAVPTQQVLSTHPHTISAGLLMAELPQQRTFGKDMA